MKYGRLVRSHVWHMIVSDKFLCIGRAPSDMNVTETSETPPRELVCENCDGILRDKGKARRPKRAPSKAVYVPRHKFEDQ